MDIQEFEVKILEINPDKIQARLSQLKAVKIFQGHIVADFFKNAAGIKLRLRKMDNKNILTFKTPHSQEGIRHNTETEISFDNYDGMKQVLLAAGFEYYGHSEKSRISYEYQGIHFDIDTVPGIPTFLEVEANNAADVEKGVVLMGYSMAQTSTLTERLLKEHYGLV